VLDQEFDGRTVPATGAGGWIGAAIASAFAERGATLVLNDLRIPSGQEDLGEA